tara:strand:+ start:23 stop:325 length:303 start_codon:yes stop_codon:yes gene_type:complete
MKKSIALLILTFCFVTSSFAFDKKEYDTIITVKGLVCPSCAIGLKNKLKRHFLVKKLYMDTKTQNVYLDHVSDDKVIKSDEIKKIVEDSGYEVSLIKYKT